MSSSIRLDDLATFSVVAEHRSFTKAAAQLGVSQSALSHGLKALEERLGLRLLARTTRSVAPTAAGEKLLARLGPALGEIQSAVDDLHALRGRPSGTVRLTTTQHAADTILRPMLLDFFEAHPSITVEVDVDEALADIVASRFDAGIRFGEQVARDMIAVPVSGPMRAALVASPGYFEHHPRPRVPRDLLEQRCILYRFKTAGTLYAWELEEEGREIRIRVNGPLVVSDTPTLIGAALDGYGIAYTFENHVAEHLASGRLVRVLAAYCPPFPGYYMYYAGNKQSPALRALAEALRVKRRLSSRGTPRRGRAG